MSAFYEELVRGLNEAIAMEKGDIKMQKVSDMPAPTYIASEVGFQTDDLEQVNK